MAKGPNSRDQQAWDKLRQQDTQPAPPPKRARRARTITRRQARLLEDLSSQLGLPYTGEGMTRAEATRAITKLIAQRDAQNPGTVAFHRALRLVQQTPGEHPWERH